MTFADLVKEVFQIIKLWPKGKMTKSQSKAGQMFKMLFATRDCDPTKAIMSLRSQFESISKEL